MAAIPEQIPGLGPKADRPRFNQAADLTVHRLTPVEGFVLSRVDGTASYEQICLITGMGVDTTLEILRRLRSEGLILGPNETQRAPEPPPRAAAAPDRPTLLARLDDLTEVKPEELVTGRDLPMEFKTRIIRLHRRLKKLGPHDMLGVARDADRGTIKRAYFAASKELHPDRYYGKDLGIFREKLGDIFARLTEAFQSIEQKK